MPKAKLSDEELRERQRKYAKGIFWLVTAMHEADMTATAEQGQFAEAV